MARGARGVLDDGTWIVLVFEDVDGRLPATPWDRDELARVLAATAALAVATDRRPPTRRPAVRRDVHGVAHPGRRAGRGRGCVVPRADLDDLVALEARWAESASGDCLLHGDLRSDNVLVDATGDVTFVDWTSACVGSSWFDVACMLPSVELEGGGPPESVLALAGLGDLDPATLLPVVVAITGYFTNGERQPDPPGLPTLRAFQRAQGAVTLAWLRRLWPQAPGTG